VAWVKMGDDADMYPRLMEAASHPKADGRTVNELFGFIMRCAAYSAAHLTDSIIEMGVVYTYAGGNPDVLQIAFDTGLIEWVDTPKGRKPKLLEDPDFVHIRSRADVEWSRQRQRDNSDQALRQAVIARDGDQCRWCGVEVYWPGKTSARKGTLDHLKPGEAGTVDTLVVACTRCNSSRADDPTGSWDQTHELLPVPERPRYGTFTRGMLTRAGVLRGAEAVPSAAAGGRNGERASAHAADGDPASGAPTSGVTSGCADASVTVSAPGGASVGSPMSADSSEPDQLAVESGLGDPGAARTITTPKPGYKQVRGFTSTRVGLDSPRPLDSCIPGYGYGYGYGSGIRVPGRDQEGQSQVGTDRDGLGQGRDGQATAVSAGRSRKRSRRRRKR
jgi:5-methylcytosine-specific restriction endonuclease McrA